MLKLKVEHRLTNITFDERVIAIKYRNGLLCIGGGMVFLEKAFEVRV